MRSSNLEAVDLWTPSAAKRGGFGPKGSVKTAGALAGKTWRIGLMGFASKASNVILCITALGTVLNQQGFDCNTNAALKAVADRYV